MDDFRLTQALCDQVEMPLRGSGALGGFFLEDVEHIQNSLKTDRVCNAVGFAVAACANLQNATPESLEWFRARGMLAELHLEQCLSDLPPRSGRKRLQVAPAGPDKDRWFDPAEQFVHKSIVFLL